MKAIIYILATTMLLIGCKKDECENAVCLNGGTCISGTCSCPDGYYGVNCENSTEGYDCISGTCVYVSKHAYYSSYTLCVDNCEENNDCFSTPFYGTQNCDWGYVSVSPTYCCPIGFPYHGFETGFCYTTCLAAKDAGNSTIVFGTGEEGGGGTSGYNCVNGNCEYVTSNSTYVTIGDCNLFCSGGNDCFSTPYYGSQNCDFGYVAVSPTSCCPTNFPYLGSETGSCYSTCLAAKNAGNSTIVFGTGEEGGGGTNGSVVFWVQTDMGCGTIEVNLSGFTQIISSSYSSSPDCGDIGCATFSLAPGNYTYSASCSQYTWGPSTVNITSGGCLRLELQ